MTKRQTFELAAGLILWVAIIGVIVHYHNEAHKPATKPAAQTQQSNPCPDTKPCIELTAEDGTKYKLNDFRFAPNHCINILSLPDRTSRKICGNYKLDWIGPDTTKGIKASSI